MDLEVKGNPLRKHKAFLEKKTYVSENKRSKFLFSLKKESHSLKNMQSLSSLILLRANHLLIIARRSLS